MNRSRIIVAALAAVAVVLLGLTWARVLADDEGAEPTFTPISVTTPPASTPSPGPSPTPSVDDDDDDRFEQITPAPRDIDDDDDDWDDDDDDD